MIKAGFLWGLVVALTGWYALTAGVGPRTVDEWSAYWIAESLVQRGSLAVPQAPAMGMAYGLRGRAGRFYSPTEPLPSMLMAPFQGLGAGLARTVAPGNESYSYFLPGSLVVLASALVTALTALLVCLCAQELGASSSASAITALVYGVGTIAWPYGGFLFREPFLALCLMAAFWCLLRSQREDPLAWVLRASFILGLGVFCKRETLFAMPGMALLALTGVRRFWPLRWREGALLCIGPGIAGLLQLAYNNYRFFDPLEFGYPAIDETGASLVAFSTPLLTGLYGLLASPGKSLLLFSPPLIASIPSLVVYGAKRRPTAIAGIGLIVGASLLVIAQWNHWEGGWCWGPRHSVPWTPFLILGLGFFLDAAFSCSVRRRVFLPLVGGLAAAGVVVQCLGVFVDYYAYAHKSGAYIQRLNEYQIDFSPWAAHWQLFLWGLAQPFNPHRGFDLWFVFLSRSPDAFRGVAEAQGAWLPVAIAALQGASVLVGIWLMARHWPMKSEASCAIAQ